MAAEVLEDVNVVDYNFEKICRLCLSDDGPMLSLRELVQSNIPNTQRDVVRRMDKIYYSVCIMVAEHDDLPCQICQKCDSLVNDYYNFKETCSVVDLKLHGLAKRRKELHNAQTYFENEQQSSRATDFGLPKELVLKPDIQRHTLNSNVQIPFSKEHRRPFNKYKSKYVDRLLKPTEYEFINTPPLNLTTDSDLDKNEITLETVLISNTVHEEEKEENVEDPLALRVEDLKNVNNYIQYNNKSKGCREAESFFLVKDEQNIVNLLMQGSSDSCKVVNQSLVSEKTQPVSVPCDADVAECEINLDCVMLKEDVTLDDIFSRKNVGGLLNFDNQLMPCKSKLKVVPKESKRRRKSDIDEDWLPLQHYKITSPIIENTIKCSRARSPLCSSERIVPKLKLKAQTPTKDVRKSQRVAPYTYSKRCTKLATSVGSISEEPKDPNQPSSQNNSHDDDKDEEEWCPIQPLVRVCVECGETFSTYSSLVTHIKTHNAVRKVSNCTLCEKTFTSEVLLNSHIFMKHKDKKDKNSLCHICGMVLDEKRALTHHMNKHLGKKDFLCDTCGAGYYNRFDLVHHIKRKHLEAGKPKLKCSYCSAEVSTPESMKRHMLLHTRGPTEKCPLCPKLFSRKAQVDRHMRSHTGETPFVCEVCHRGFTIKWNYTQHMRLHTKDKPYVCEICGKAFTHNVSRRSHMKRHVNEKGFKEEALMEVSRKFRRVGTRILPIVDIPVSVGDSVD